MSRAGDDRVTVVYVEDNQSNLDMVARILESTGRYRVVGATDGSEGLAAVERERPALVLVDLDVPTVNGFEIARRMRGSSDPQIASIPILAVSANVIHSERQAAIDAGCVDFIEKPFDITEFRREIDRVVRTGGRSS